jgi:hypothetical protein
MPLFDKVSTGAAVEAAAVIEGLAAQGVVELVEAGALVSIGKTRDGGALGVTVTVDGEWTREYFREAEALALWIGEVLPVVQEARGTDRPSAVDGKRSRRR